MFGNGDKVVTHGTYDDKHCVFVSDAKMPGDVGQSAEREGIDNDYLGTNPIVIVTQNEKRALIIHHALTGELDDLEI